MKKLQLLGLLALFLWSCSSDQSPQGRPPEKVQYAHGRVNEILVIADSSLWKSAVGDTFFYYFAAPYLLMPQPEPIFDIRHLTPEQLAVQTVKKEFRTILFVADLNDQNSSTSRIVQADVGAEKTEKARLEKGYGATVALDKWAKRQTLFYVFGFGEKKLVQNIAANFAPLARRIGETDAEVVKATAYQAGESAALTAEVKEKFGADLKVPGDFKKVKFDPQTNTLWLRRDVREVVASILIHKRKYTSKEQLSKAGVKAIRNEAGRIVTSEQPNSHMRVNDVDLPLFVENKTLSNRYAVQAKGVWEMVNDFKGGPFVSNLLLRQDSSELLLLDGFILAPQKDKRNYMQELELVISSASF